MWFENPPTTSGPVLKPELYSYYRLEHGPQTITVKSKVRSNLMVLSLYKVEGGYKTKNLPNQGCLAKKKHCFQFNMPGKKALNVHLNFPTLFKFYRSPELSL